MVRRVPNKHVRVEVQMWLLLTVVIFLSVVLTVSLDAPGGVRVDTRKSEIKSESQVASPGYRVFLRAGSLQDFCDERLLGEI